MKLILTPYVGNATWVEWNPVKGTLTGPAADEVRRRVQQAVADGSVCTNPMPTCYDISDPLHSRRDMAVVLSEVWLVPEQVKDDFPDPPQEPPVDPSLPVITMLH